MARELVFTVNGERAKPAQEVSMLEAGLFERQHLQEWVLSHPELLGDEAKIVSFEFDRWASHSARTADRLDVLAVDRTGRLIVGELKRDRAPDTVTMQAINYAAMVSRFNLDVLATVYAAHLGGGTTTDDALNQLRDWAPEVSDETLGSPRIVLLASDFSPTVTNTALYLYENNLDIRLVRYQLYRTANDELVLTVSQLIPIPDTEEFMVRPRSSGATQAAARAARVRRASIAQRLVNHEVLPKGAELTIVVPDAVHEDRDTINAWLDEDPTCRRVRWRHDPQLPVEWERDGRQYSFPGLIRQVIEEATAASARTQIWGPNWLRDSNGVALPQLAEPFD